MNLDNNKLINKQIGSALENTKNPGKSIYLKLYVTKNLDTHFCTVLDNLHAKEGTIVKLIGKDTFFTDLDTITNWTYFDEYFEYKRKEVDDDFIGMFYIWDLIAAVKNSYDIYYISDMDSIIHNMEDEYKILYKYFIDLKNETGLMRDYDYLSPIQKKHTIEKILFNESPNIIFCKLEELDRENINNQMEKIVTIKGNHIQISNKQKKRTVYYKIDNNKYGYTIATDSQLSGSARENPDRHPLLILNINQIIKLCMYVEAKDISPALHPEYPFLIFYKKTEDRFSHTLVTINENYEETLRNYIVGNLKSLFDSQSHPQTTIFSKRLNEIFNGIDILINKLIENNIFYLDIKLSNIVKKFDDSFKIRLRIIDWDIKMTCHKDTTPISPIYKISELMSNNKTYKDICKYIMIIFLGLDIPYYIKLEYYNYFILDKLDHIIEKEIDKINEIWDILFNIDKNEKNKEFIDLNFRTIQYYVYFMIFHNILEDEKQLYPDDKINVKNDKYIQNISNQWKLDKYWELDNYGENDYRPHNYIDIIKDERDVLDVIQNLENHLTLEQRLTSA